MNWNYDLAQAPRDGSHVILAMPNKTTLRSYWCEPKGEPAHWCMLSHKNEPVAWMPWPEHPFQAKANDEACETVSDLRRAEAKAEASDGVELVSRVAGGRTPDATSEGMDVTGGESAATSFQVSNRANGESGANASKGVTAGETATHFILEDVGGGA